MDEKTSVIRRWIMNRPFAFFSLGIIPGFVAVVLYLVEMNIRGIDHPYSVNGQIIAPYNLSIVIITSYILSIFSTIYGLVITLQTWGKLKTNFEMMIDIAQKRGIPGYLVFQVLQIGYTMPIIGFIKGFELLIWIFPSVVNVYYGTYGMVIAALPPILSFLNNGSNKNIYPLVPIFSNLLGTIYVKSSTEKAWNPFYSKGSNGVSHLIHETKDVEQNLKNKLHIDLSREFNRKMRLENSESYSALNHNFIFMLKNAKIKTSSVLNKDSKNYGKQFLTDNNPETCWNSAQGNGQFIQIEFDEPTKISKLKIQFQGGFCGKNVDIVVDDVFLQHIYPTDSSDLQVFDLEFVGKKVKILFVDGTDFYGRIVIYHLDLE
ncbi:Nuclear receptor 2C2-associated protein [Boothiomyces macroporosus]|uniref:Nuclear receptor 2C2-associated protein n=1 Tax=Boothiomyces macroporosus TaxID=261099 RepID=A0AAD5Y2K4_9FUNG|nr:Nuclear receptor 2C2-associated protein [Boothiomyces macroporosus]